MQRFILGLVMALALVIPAAPVLPSLTPAASALSQTGRFTMTGLGETGGTTLSAAVYDWGCRGGTIGTRAYEWGCAGTNNRYVLGHAYASFAALHDFVAARGVGAGTKALVGRIATWTSVSGTTARYKVVWAKVVSVDYWGRTGEDWAWNARPIPSITLQTCYGSSSQYRIVVRLALTAS